MLVVAIVAEIAATTSLKLSEGFSKPIPSLFVVVGYVIAFWLLSAILQRGMEVGVVYAIWSAAGVAIVAIIGIAFLGESISWLKALGVLFVIAGVVTLQLAGVE